MSSHVCARIQRVRCSRDLQCADREGEKVPCVTGCGMPTAQNRAGRSFSGRRTRAKMIRTNWRVHAVRSRQKLRKSLSDLGGWLYRGQSQTVLRLTAMPHADGLSGREASKSDRGLAHGRSDRLLLAGDTCLLRSYWPRGAWTRCSLRPDNLT